VIIRLALAYAIAALAVCTPGLILATVVYVQTWRDVRNREDT
jgi:hypothetical protein